MNPLRPQDKAIWNAGRRCYVDGVNIAVRHSAGEALIVNADDQYSCDGWDSALMEASEESHPGEFVINVSTNTPNEHERGIMVMPILSRSRYKRLGYALYPDYESMYSDNDFAAHAIHDGCVIDARKLVFPHKHPLVTGEEWDEAYMAQNRQEAYASGRVIFERRKASGFTADNTTAAAASVDPRPLIAVCLPGDTFSQTWVSSWMALFCHLTSKFRVSVTMSYSSCASVTRATMADALDRSGADFDYVLWIDDDNTLSPQQFDLLYADLQEHAELDVVVGWCWVAANDREIEPIVSCGRYSADRRHAALTVTQLNDSPTDLIQIDASGFPAVLMRYGTIDRAGNFPFRPIIDDRFSWGKSGEDHAFFIKAAEGGCKFAMDRRVKVPHFKRRAVEPMATVVTHESQVEVLVK
jgi:hypothetical protein